MHRAFRTALAYFRPEAVFFLGDLFDEGKWCPPEEFAAYVERFRHLFSVDPALTKVCGGISAVLWNRNYFLWFRFRLQRYLDHKKQIFQKNLWKNLSFLHSKLFYKEKIDKFHQIYCKT
jgi:hypothetical protein